MKNTAMKSMSLLIVLVIIMSLCAVAFAAGFYPSFSMNNTTGAFSAGVSSSDSSARVSMDMYQYNISSGALVGEAHPSGIGSVYASGTLAKGNKMKITYNSYAPSDGSFNSYTEEYVRPN